MAKLLSDSIVGSSQRISSSGAKTLGRDFAHGLSFSFSCRFRQENQKLKELVTGAAAVAAAAAAAASSDTEAPEAKEEPMKEESAAVRPKMEATTPQKVDTIK